MAENQIIKIPGARFVSGDMLNKRTKNARMQDIPPEKQQFEIGLAVRKDSPEVATFFGQLGAACKAVCPANVHPYVDNWFQTLDGFSMKVGDGDKPSLRTQQVNPNTAGCWVVYLSSSFPFNTYDTTNAQIDPAQIKRGYYVDGTATVAYNGQAPLDGCGIFMNPGMLRMIGVGEEIRGGLDEAAHGAALGAPQLPPGAQPVGSAPPAPALPGMGTAAPGMTPNAGTPAAPPMPVTAPPQTTAPSPAVPGVPPQTPTGTGYPSNHPATPPGVAPYPGIMPTGQ